MSITGLLIVIALLFLTGLIMDRIHPVQPERITVRSFEIRRVKR